MLILTPEKNCGDPQVYGDKVQKHKYEQQNAA